MKLSAYRISNGLLTAWITNYGASLMDLRLRGIDHALVLGFPSVDDYPTDGQFMGAVIGRYANRITGGHVPWNGSALTLEKNENGATHLHGGAEGFANQVWKVDQRSDTSVSLRHVSPDGHAGYPGTLTATATYELTDTTLQLRLSATTNKDTIVNLCHHPYFTLDGRADIDQHRLRIGAEHYLPSDKTLVPIGEIASVSGTSFDFTKPSAPNGDRYNHTYCLHHRQAGQLAHVATLQAGPVAMELHTTQPGLHLYNGYKITPKALGHHGTAYAAGSGLCLEAQAWPDSPNHMEFPDVTLKAGHVCQQITEYRFTVTQPVADGRVEATNLGF